MVYLLFLKSISEEVGSAVDARPNPAATKVKGDGFPLRLGLAGPGDGSLRTGMGSQQ